MLKKYTHNRKIVCYIIATKNGFQVKTGKPSDSSCISWDYETMEQAEKTAEEYFNNRINFFN